MNDKKIIAVVPARMEASRFPGKPLAQILGLPLIEHVRRRVALCEIIDEVYVATCDQEIIDVVEQNGGKAIMTANTHQRCTDRVQEAAQQLDADIVVIFQGDEPLFLPEVANKMIEPMLEDETILCANLLSTINDKKDVYNTDIIKTILNFRNYVMYYSRSPIPYMRGQNDCPMYRQTGLSAFRKEFLKKFACLSPTPLEIIESIDFLRIIEHGFPVLGIIYDQEMFGVDQPDHIVQIENVLQEDQSQKKIYRKIL